MKREMPFETEYLETIIRPKIEEALNILTNSEQNTNNASLIRFFESEYGVRVTYTRMAYWLQALGYKRIQTLLSNTDDYLPQQESA